VERANLPSRSRFVANMVHAEIVHNHDVPVIILQLSGNVPCDIIVDFCKVLVNVLAC